MNNMKYLVTHIASGIKMSMEFGEDGFLKSWVIDGEMELKLWREIWSAPPYNTIVLRDTWPLRGYEVKEVVGDISFVAFWDAYAYKMGDKKKTEKLWNTLSEPEMIAAMTAIKKYHYWLACHPNTETAQAQTWLRQRRWENDYSKKK